MYQLEGDRLREMASLKEPRITDIKYCGPVRRSTYSSDCAAYDRHIASLKSYPILPGSTWVKKEGLVEGVDFKFQVCDCGIGHTCKVQPGKIVRPCTYALPLFLSGRGEPQERVYSQAEANEIYKNAALQCFKFSGLPHEFADYVNDNLKEYFKTK